MADPRFTFQGYEELISHILDCGYTFADYHNYHGIKRPCILRHDVDYDIHRAAQFAEQEAKIHSGLKSTYFLLVSGDFYNIMAKSTIEAADRILSCGHEIGLHFDETKYPVKGNAGLYAEYVGEELDILGRALKTKVSTVSMHRPTRFTLEGDLKFHSAVNSLSEELFTKFKYLSDSRMRWREDAYSIIKSKEHERLQVLTHPFWYSEREETTRDKLLSFISRANKDRYGCLSNNFSRLEEFVRPEDIR